MPLAVFGPIVEHLGAARLLRGGRVAVEKPFGHALASARELNASLHRLLPESLPKVTGERRYVVRECSEEAPGREETGVMTARHAENLTAGGIQVDLSHTDKVLFPGDDEITKGDLIEYYAEVADRMLPYLRERPIAMARYPDGITHQRIFQKNVPGYFPDWVTRARVRKQDGVLQQVICDKPATLVYLANQACIELHAFLSRLDRLDYPDQLVFDLDPADADHFGDARIAALRLRELLADELGLTAFVKTTGGKGLHVQVSLRAEDDFDTVRGFARQAGELLAARNPDLVTIEQRKDKRDRRLYVDIMRNAYAQTIVAPYVVRARPGAPVAVPLHWDEVADAGLEPGRFTLRTVRPRLSELDQAGDPWAGLTKRRYSLTKAETRLDELTRARLAASSHQQHRYHRLDHRGVVTCHHD